MTAPGDAARCHLVPGRSVVRPVRPTAEARTRPQSYTISEGANTPTIAKRDQKPPDDPSDNLLVLTYAAVMADTAGASSNDILTHFATVVGNSYTVNFDFGDYAANQFLTLDLMAPTGETVLASSVFAPVVSDPKGLDPYTWTFVAQYGVSYLEFEYDNASGFDPGYVDNVDVEPGATGVPEPASIGLVLIGLAATVCAARRRRGLVV